MAKVSGTIRRAEAGAEGLRVVCLEDVVVGVPSEPEPCRTGHPSVRVLGTTTTDAAGHFEIEFEPTAPPADACEFGAQLSVRVYDGETLLWASPKRGLTEEVVFPHDLEAVEPEQALSSATLTGRLTLCGRPVSGHTVVAHQVTRIGVPVPPDPCRIGTNRRTIGSTTVGGDGRFTFSFQPANDTGHNCFFSDAVEIVVTDRGRQVWRSGERRTAAFVRINHDLGDNCEPDDTLVQVVDDRGRRVEAAEVFVNGRSRGSTDGAGRLVLPRLQRGDVLVARTLVHQEPTGRDGHRGGERGDNWSYRVYLTSVALSHDVKGNNVALHQHTVTDPDGTQQLRVPRSNPLIGLNLLASVEWRATRTELQRYVDRLTDLGELLFNGTDGQFFVEHVSLQDDRRFWSDADVRVHASLDRRSTARIGGVFGTSGRIDMNPNDMHFPGTLLHEIGHYAFAVRDEYLAGSDWDPDNGPVRCTLRSTDDSGPFRDGGPKDACFMRGSRFRNRKKLCSPHADNPHVSGTAQGDEDCLTTLLRHWSDSSRWQLRSPHGPPVDRLPDSGVDMPTTTAPDPRVLPAQSYIPVQGWKARRHQRTTPPEGRCDHLVVRTTIDGEPADGVQVGLESGGRQLQQGATRARNGLVYGVTTGPGEVTVRGAHVGDRIQATKRAGATLHRGTGSVEACDTTLTIALRRVGFAAAAVESAAPGALRVRTAGGAAVVSVSVLVDGADHAFTVPVAAESPPPTTTVEHLPSAGSVELRVTALDPAGQELVVDQAATLRTLYVDEAVSIASPDGALLLRVPAGALAPPCQLVLSDASGEVPEPQDGRMLVAGPFSVTCSDGGAPALPVLADIFPPPASWPDDDAPALDLLRYDPDDQAWETVPGFAQNDPLLLHAPLERFGTYALAAQRR